MAMVMVAIVGAFFLLFLLSIYIRKCAHRELLVGETLLNGVGQLPREARETGLERAVVESFPTFVYAAVKRLRLGKSSLECAVCLNEFEEDERLRLVPKCSHVFHPHCIDVWLSGHTTCPVCRANLVPKPGEIFYGSVHAVESDSETERSNRRNPDELEREVSITVDEDEPSQVTEFPIVNLISPNQHNSQNRPPRPWSNRFRFLRRFSRSHSTGHSLAQQDSNHERFTLVLTEEVTAQLVNSSFNRSKSCLEIPPAQSSKTDYRERSPMETNHSKLQNRTSDKQEPENSSLKPKHDLVHELDKNVDLAMETRQDDQPSIEERSFVGLLSSADRKRS